MKTLLEISQAACRGGLTRDEVIESLRRYAAVSSINSIPSMPTSATLPANLRDYFIAHAPAEPQPWFQPVMRPCPQLPAQLRDLTKQEKDELAGWKDWLATCKLTCARVIDYACAHDSASDAIEQWKRDRERERFLQWPAAWADEQLQRREQWIRAQANEVAS